MTTPVLVHVLQAVFVGELGLGAVPEDQLRDWADMARRLLLCSMIPREHELRNVRFVPACADAGLV